MTKKTSASVALIILATTSPARADDSIEEARVIDGAIAAVAGAVIAGPIGLLAGAMIGYAAGPEITGSITDPKPQSARKKPAHRRTAATARPRMQAPPAYPPQYYQQQPVYQQLPVYPVQPLQQPPLQIEEPDYPVSSVRPAYSRAIQAGAYAPQAYPVAYQYQQPYPVYQQPVMAYPAPLVYQPQQVSQPVMAQQQAPYGTPAQPMPMIPPGQKIYNPQHNPMVPPPAMQSPAAGRSQANVYAQPGIARANSYGGLRQSQISDRQDFTASTVRTRQAKPIIPLPR